MKNLPLLISLACLSTALFGCDVQLSEEDMKAVQRNVQWVCSNTKGRNHEATYEGCMEITKSTKTMAGKRLNLKCKKVLEVAKERGCI